MDLQTNDTAADLPDTDTPLPDDVARRVIAFSDADAVPVETHATWTAAGGLTAFTERDQVFADVSPAEPMGFERVIWG